MARDHVLHLTDFHFWEVVYNPLRLLNKRFIGNLNVWRRRRKEFVLDRAEPYLDYAVSTGAEAALLTGDFSSTATPKECAAGAEFARTLAERSLQVYAIPGNHDVYTWESVRKQRFEQYFDAWFPEEGLPAKRTLPGGTDVLFVPTVRPDILSRGWISDVEVEGVSELLRTASAPLVVAGHYPLLHETYGYTAKPPRRLRNAEGLRRTLGRCDLPILYICGHVHRFSYVRDPEFPNLSHLTTGAFLRTAPESDSRGEFSEIHVDDGAFRVVRHLKREEWSTHAVDPQQA